MEMNTATTLSAYNDTLITRAIVDRKPIMVEWLYFYPEGDTQWSITDPTDSEITHCHIMYPSTPLSKVAETVRRWAMEYKRAYFDAH